MTIRVLRAMLLTTLMIGAAAGAAGCAQRLGRVPPEFRNDHESGVAVIGNNYKLTAQATIHTDKPVLFNLKSNEPRTYAHHTAYPDFRAYVNPMKPPLVPVDVPVNFSTPSVGVPSGWAYLVGVSPIGETTRVRAVGDGTRMIIEVDELVTPAVHRVYFLGEFGCSVGLHVPPTATETTPELTLTQVGSYAEVRDDMSVHDMGLYSANRERARFVADVLSQTQDRGVN